MDTIAATSRKDSLASLRRKALPLSLSLLLCGALASTPAAAGTVGATSTPTGGSIVGGSGSIVQDGASVVINQASQKLALDWQSFNLGQDASVRFNQPGASAVALNRILDQNASQIFGQISSNGQVFLINTHGIIFGSTAQVNVGGLVASTLDLTPTDFLSAHFNLNAVGGGAGVVNHGTIAAASGGSVSLVGGSVQNDGVILANYGRINLDGADHAVLDFDGNGLINVQITGALAQRLDAKAAVSNAGRLQAEGGTVVLEANAARDLFTDLVNNSGVVDAGGISHDGGVVRLVARGGDTVDSGRIDVTGSHGGSAQLLSDRNVSVSGEVDASGAQGGGRIRLGGGERGGEGLLRAQTSSLGAGASLSADATQGGSGGSIVVWGDHTVDVAGRFSARGGALGGDGGSVETSAETVNVADGAAIDTRATYGHAGHWLIDPREYTIAASGGNITGAALSTNLGTTDVTILSDNGSSPSGSGSIFVNDGVSWSAHTLTLTAANNIEINAAMSASGSAGLALNPATTNGGSTAVAGGHVNINATGALTLAGTGGMALAGSVNDAGALDISGLASGLSIDSLAGAGTVALGGNTLTLNNAADSFGGVISGTGGVTLAGGNETFGGANTYSGGTALDGGTLTVSSDANLGAASGGLTFNGGTLANSAAFVSGRNITLQAGNGTLQTAANLGLSGIVSGSGSLTKAGSGTLTLSNTNTYGGGTQVSGGTLAISSDANLGASSGSLTLDGGTLENTASLTLNRTLALGAAGGTLQTDAATGLTLTGAVNGAGSLTQTGTGALTLGGNVTTAGNQTYNGPVLLGTDVTLTSTGGAVDLAGTVDNAGATKRALSVDAAGAATFGGAVGAGANGSLASLTTSSQTFSAGALAVAGSLSATTTAGAIAQGGAFQVGGASTFNAGSQAITLTNPSNAFVGAVSLTGGAVQITNNGPLGLGATNAASLLASASGNAITLGGDVTTSGAQTYNDAVLLGANVSLTSTGAGTIGFGSTVDGAYALALNTIGSTTFGGAVGGATALASLTTDAGGSTTLNGNVTTSGAQTYRDAVTLGANLALSSTGGGAVGFGSSLDGVYGLVVNTAGGTSFGGAVGGNAALASLTTDAGGGTTLAGNVTTSGAQTYNDAVTLGANVALASNGSGAIGFGGTVDGAHSLTLNTGGVTRFGGAVGAGTALTSLTTDAGGSTTLGGNVTTSGAQAYNDALVLGADTALTSTGNGAIGFASTVDGAHVLSVNTGGATSFGSTVGAGTALASLSTDAGGSTTLGGNVTTSGAQGYGDAVTLGADAVLASAGNGAIGFGSTLDGAHSLVVDTGGVTTFGGPVGGTTALTSLATDAGGGTTLGGNLTTSGAQTYGDAVSLAADVNLASLAGGTIGFASTLDGAHALALSTGGAGNFGGVVGGTTMLAGLTTQSGTLSVTGTVAVGGNLSVTTTTGGISQGGAFTVGGTAHFDAGAHAITLTGANDFGGAVSLSNTGANDVALAGVGMLTLGDINVGSGLLSLSAAAGLQQANGTTVVQGGAGAVNVDAGTGALSLANSGNDFVGGVTATGTGVAVNDSNDLTIAGLSNNGGAVSLVAGGTLTLPGGAIDTGSADLTLAANGGSLSTTGDLKGRNVSLTGRDGLVIGNNVTASGTLGLASTGAAISQTAGLLTVGSTSTVNAGSGSITLTGANDFVGAVNLTGGTTQIADANALALGTLATGNLTVVSTGNLDLGKGAVSGTLQATSNGGAIGQDAGGLTVSGNTSINAGSGAITLTDGNNDFVGAVDLSGGTAAIQDKNALVLGALATGALTATSTNALNLGGGSVGGDLTATSGSGGVSQAGALAVSGNSDIHAGSGTITLAGPGNVFTGAVSLAGAATQIESAAGLVLGTLATGDLTATSSGTLNLGSGTVGGFLTATSNGTLSQSGGLTVTGTGTLNAGSGAIALMDAGNDFQASLSLAGNGVAVRDANDLTIGTLANASNSSVSLVAGGVLALPATAIGTGTGDLALAADGGTLQTQAALGGANVSLRGRDGVSLAHDVTATNTLTLASSAGNVTQTAGTLTAGALTGSAGGSVALGGANAIGQLGSFSANGFSLLTSGALAVTGPLDGGSGNVSLHSGGALGIAGNITGAGIALQGDGGIGQSGGSIDAGSGQVSLQSGAGITQTGGSISAGTLAGSAAGDASLAGGNHLGTLGGFSAANLVLANAGGLTVAGPVTASGNAALSIGGDLAIDGTLSAASTSLNVNGSVTEGASGNLVTGALGGQAGGSVGLTGSNHVGTLGNFNAANFALTNGQALTVNGSLGVGTGNVALTTTTGALNINAALNGGGIALGSAADLVLGKTVQGSAVSLTSAGSISQSATGLITAGTLSGQSAGSTVLDQANAIGALGNITANGLSVASTQAMNVAGVVDGGASTELSSGGNLRIDGTLRGTATALSALGAIGEGAGGTLVAHTLTGQAGGAANLDGANRIDTLGPFQATGFGLHNVQDLNVTGTLDGGTSAALTVAGNLVLGGTVKGGATHMSATGTLTETGAGRIVADTLDGHAGGNADLTGANAIARLGNFDAVGLALVDGQALTIDGTVDGGASSTLTTTTGGLTVGGSLAGASTTLHIAGAIDQTTHGRITAGTLVGQAGGDVALDGDNRIDVLGSFGAHDFALSNGQALTVNGPLAAGGGNISLATTAGRLSVNTDLDGQSIALASAGDLTLGHAIHGGVVSLQSGGAISQSAGGLITADRLSGRSAGSTLLDQANAVAAVGDFGANGLSLATRGALVVDGMVDGGGSTTLATGGNLHIVGTLSGDTTTLAVNGAISEAANGGIDAHTLSGNASGSAALDGANRIDTLGAFTATGFALINGPSLAVNGPLDGGDSVSLATTRGDLAINGKVSGKTVTLNSSGAIAEGQGGSITAATLSGRAGGRTQLGTAASPLANYVGTLGGFSSPAGFSLTNAQTLTLASVGGSGYTVDAGTAAFYLGVTGGDLLQAGTTPLFDGEGAFASTGRIGTSAAPIYVTGTGAQAVAMVGMPPAYFYAVNRGGALLPLTGGSSVNVPTSLFTSRAQNANNHTDTYIDPSVISANYRSFGIVPSGILLPPDQQACDPQQDECDE